MTKRKLSETNLACMARETTKLKKELQKHVDAIVEEDDYETDEGWKAITTLSALKELNFRKLTSLSSKGKGVSVPEEFLCPISGELMIHPVAVASGETYDERSIQKWFREVSRTCPKTKNFLHNTPRIPNRLVQKIIRQWCRENKIKPPNPDDPIPNQDKQDVIQDKEKERGRPADRIGLDELLDEMSSSSLSIHKRAAIELRDITSHTPEFRKLFSSDDIFRMLNPLLSGSSEVDPILREHLVSTIYNISVDPGDKKIIGECPAVLPILSASLLCGTDEGKSSSAAALGLLAELHSNKVLIGRSGALKNLISLLKEGNESDITSVSYTINLLCEDPKIRAKAVEEGLIWVILEKITRKVLVDELLLMLTARFIKDEKAIEEMAKLGAVPMCFDLIRDPSSSIGGKGNCLWIIFAICSKEGLLWKCVDEEEEMHGTLSELARNGPSETVKMAAACLLKSKPGSSTEAQLEEGCSSACLEK